MLSEIEKERLVGDMLRASYEVLTLQDLGEQIFPLIEQAFDTSASLLYRITDGGDLENIAGTQVVTNYEYFRDQYAQDPMQDLMRRMNPWIFHPSQIPQWAPFKKHPVYKWSMRQQIDNYLFVRLTDTGHDAPGSVSFL